MRAERSRTAEPIGTGPSGLAMGAWGLWLTIAVLGTGVAGIATAALYLHTGQPAWPPEGLSRPGAGRAMFGLLLAAAGTVMAEVDKRWLGRGREHGAGPLLLASLTLLLVAVWVLVRDLQAVPFRWDVHAYTSIYWVLTGTAATLLGVGVLMLAAVSIQRSMGLLDAHRHLELDITVVYLWFALLAAAVLLALVHFLPSPPTGGA